MVYVNLPLLNLEGEWAPSGEERVVAELLQRALRPAPVPTAEMSIVTRWTNVLATLSVVRTVIHANGDELLHRSGSGPNMIDIMFAAARQLHELDSYVKLKMDHQQWEAKPRRQHGWRDRLSRRGGKAVDLTEDSFLIDAEQEVAELKRLFTEVVG